MTVTEALLARRATPSFDPTVKISKAQLCNLIELACLAPSSMNLQPWEFVVCYSEADKARMQRVAMNQKKVSEASAVIAVICNLEFPQNSLAIAESNIARGYFREERREGFITGAQSFNQNPQSLRDEAIRSCNLWAMAFMMAAIEAGWNTAPMGGFVADQLITEFGLPVSRFPILLIAIGQLNTSVKMLERNVRFPVSKLVHEGNW
jgi:nitroreductase